MNRNQHKSQNDNTEEDYRSHNRMPNDGVEILPSDLDMDNPDDNRNTLQNIEIDTGVNWLSSGGNELKEILQIQNFSEEKFTKTKSNCDYIELLQLKIRKQANRLCELQEYKSICEKRILQLNPSHELPITDSHLTHTGSSSYSTEIQMSNMVSSYKFQIKDLTNKLVQKENEKKTIQVKYEELQKKHNHYVSESVPRSALNSHSNYNGNGNSTHNNSSNSIANAFPNPERIPNEKMREAYTKLLNTFREVIREKEQILDSLKIETINSEEQRNYIEILKQTMENNLQKNGLLQILEKQRNQYYNVKSSNTNCKSPAFAKPPSEFSAVDVLIDIVQLKNEIDKCRRETVTFEVSTSELQSEIEFLRDANSQMNMKKEKIREGLEKGIKELEDAKERVNALEEERTYLSEELHEMKECCENLLRENEDLNSIWKENEELRSKLENQKILEEKLIEYKNNFVLINTQLEELLTEKKNLELDREKFLNYFEENKILKEENAKIKISHKETEDRLNSLKKQCEKFQNKNNELNENLNNSITLLSEAEKNLESFKIEYEKISSNLKENVDKNFKYELLCKELEEIKTEREIISNENLKLRKINSDNISENEKLQINGNDFSKNFNKILQQLESKNKSYKNLENLHTILKIEKENLSKEIMSLKEKEKSHDTNSSKKKLNTLNTKSINASALKESEIKKLKEEIEVCKFSHNESEKVYKSEIQNLKNKLDLISGEENISNQKLLEKEKYIQSLHAELEKKEENFEKLSQLNNLHSTNEHLQLDLRSFKNDNKKLYDYNKKLQEENSKIFSIKKENQNLQNFLTIILNSLPNKEMAKLYNECLNYTEQIAGVEFEKSKILKKIQSIEKEIYKIKTEKNSSDKNSSDSAQEIKLTSEIKNLNNRLIELEKNLNEFRQILMKLQMDLKRIEGGNLNPVGSGNVFKANYLEKEKNSFENFSFEKNEKLEKSGNTHEEKRNIAVIPSRANRYTSSLGEDVKNKEESIDIDSSATATAKAMPNKEITLRKEVVLSNLSHYNTNRSRSKTHNDNNNNGNTSRNSPSSSRNNININTSDISNTNSARGKNKIKSLIKNGIPVNQLNAINPTSTLYYKRAFDIDIKNIKKK